MSHSGGSRPSAGDCITLLINLPPTKIDPDCLPKRTAVKLVDDALKRILGTTCSETLSDAEGLALKLSELLVRRGPGEVPLRGEHS